MWENLTSFVLVEIVKGKARSWAALPRLGTFLNSFEDCNRCALDNAAPVNLYVCVNVGAEISPG